MECLNRESINISWRPACLTFKLAWPFMLVPTLYITGNYDQIYLHPPPQKKGKKEEKPCTLIAVQAPCATVIGDLKVKDGAALIAQASITSTFISATRRCCFVLMSQTNSQHHLTLRKQRFHSLFTPTGSVPTIY